MLSGGDGSHGARGVLQESLGNHSVGTGDTLEGTSDGKDTVMHTGHDLGNASFDSGLVTEVGDVLSSLANDDTSLLGGDNGAKGESSSSVLLVGADSLLLLLAVVVLVVVHVELLERLVEGGILASGVGLTDIGGFVGHFS